MKGIKFCMVVLIALGSFTIDTKAEENEDLANIIIELVNYSGLSEENIKSDIVEYAKISKTDELTSAKYLLSEVKANYISQEVNSKNRSTTYFSSSSVGDIFYTDASSSLSYVSWNHGHSGIYVGPTLLVDAPGGNMTARNIWISDFPIYTDKTNYVLKVTTTDFGDTRYGETQRNAVANRALGYRRTPYNKSLINKTCSGPMNCSQLVWCAWKLYADLDSTPGDGTVLPMNLVNSYRTKITQSY